MKIRKYSVNQGQRFGSLCAEKLLEVRALKERPRNGVYIWYCRCDCGGIIRVKSTDLANGTVTRCNCCGGHYAEPELNDLTGEQFGELTVLQMLESSIDDCPRKWWEPYYLVRCSCGRKFRTRQNNLLEGFRTACEVCDPQFIR